MAGAGLAAVWKLVGRAAAVLVRPTVLVRPAAFAVWLAQPVASQRPVGLARALAWGRCRSG